MVEPAASRVLVDLSPGSFGHAGIPMETQVLFKLLSEISEIDTAGLIYSIQSPLPLRSTWSQSPDVRIECQATALSQMLLGPPPMGAFQRFLVRFGNGLRGAWKALFRMSERLERLAEPFWDLIWRRWLSRSLTENDQHLARRPMFLSKVSQGVLDRLALYGFSSYRLNTEGFDFALFHKAKPIRVSPMTCKVIRQYDSIPIVRPDLHMGSMMTTVHARSIRACRRDSIFACISEVAREELIDMYPELAERAVTIPCALSAGYYPDRQPRLLPGIIRNNIFTGGGKHSPAKLRALAKSGFEAPYLLIVCTIEPRKNHALLIQAFEKVLACREPDLHLIVVGAPGWQFEEILHRMAPHVRKGRIFHLARVPQNELRILYTHAHAVVFPSLYEGFGYSPLEAMCCGAPVIASDIPVHRAVYADAAEYCDPYSIDSLAAVIERVCLDAPPAFRAEMVQRGFRRVKRFLMPAVGAQWQALFAELNRQKIRQNACDARLADFNLELRRIEQRQEGLPGVAA